MDERARAPAGWTRRRWLAVALAAGGLLESRGLGWGADAAGPTLGALLPLSGELAAYGAQARLGIDLAVAEVNAAGGVPGGPVRVLYEDDRSDPRTAVARAVRLAQHGTVVAVIGPVSSAPRDAVAPVLDRLSLPLLYATNYEGGGCGARLFCFGTVPNQDLGQLIPHVAAAGGRRFFLIGADYTWPEAMFRRARPLIASLGAEVVGEELLPWGIRDFSRLLALVRASGATSLLLALPGRDGITLIDQAATAGVLKDRAVAFLGLNEALLGSLGAGRAEGLFCAVPMVMDSPEPGVRDFVGRVQRQAGAAVVVSGYVLTHYNAVMACVSALRKAGTADRDAVTAGLPGLTFDSPTGPVSVGRDHHVTLAMYLARSAGGRLALVRPLGRLAPESGCGS
jgi:branched-chain amino acid transport system substrate-binding protein/urea transport system substrate-binding protein